jgi:enoyl-CoA hydratase/carnithine racemase
MIELDRDGDVFVLRMHAGENRFAPDFLAALHGALDTVEGSSGPAALVSVGDGRFYSNGLDLEGLAAAGPGVGLEVVAQLERAFARLLAFPMATVAAVNGHAFAGGAMLALAHDFRVMRADRGFLCLPEVDLATGQPLSDGMYALLEARLPRSLLSEMLVTGHRYGGEEAAGRGLVAESAPEAEVLSRAVEWAQTLAGKHRATMAAIKRGLHRGALGVLESGAERGG